MSAVADPADIRSAAPSRRRWLRLLLMAAVPLAIVLVGGWYWVLGERYVSTDNAYVHQFKVAVSADVAGRVTEVAVRENEHVKAGQLLFRIDPEPYRLAVQQADAVLADARLKVEQLRAAYGEAQAAVRAAEETVSYEQGEFQRQQRLLSSGVASQSKYDETRHALQAAQQQLAQARQAQESARAGLAGDPDIPTDRHPSVLEAVAKLAEAQRDLAHTATHAPADGIVSQTDRVRVGQYMGVGAAALSLVEADASWVEANFKETDLTHMAVGQDATVTLDTYPGHPLHARVESIGAGTGAEFSLLPAQNATGNWVKVVQRVPVRLRFDRASLGEVPLRTGLSAEVDVDTRYVPDLPGPLHAALALTGVTRGAAE